MTRMDYTLAKELKDAGFPQLLGHDLIYPDGRITRAHETFVPDSDAARLPTLSELIEACGGNTIRKDDEKTGGRYAFHLRATRTGWYAGFFDVTFEELEQMGEQGATPEEAVARLWLALNKPQ